MYCTLAITGLTACGLGLVSSVVKATGTASRLSMRDDSTHFPYLCHLLLNLEMQAWLRDHQYKPVKVECCRRPSPLLPSPSIPRSRKRRMLKQALITANVSRLCELEFCIASLGLFGLHTFSVATFWLAHVRRA